MEEIYVDKKGIIWRRTTLYLVREPRINSKRFFYNVEEAIDFACESNIAAIFIEELSGWEMQEKEGE